MKRKMDKMDLMEIRELTTESRGQRHFLPFLWLLWIVWLPFLISPILQLLKTYDTVPQLILTLIGLVLFLTVYLHIAVSITHHFSVVSQTPQAPQASIRTQWLPIVFLTVLSLVITLYTRENGSWLGLFIFTSASTGGLLHIRKAAGMLVIIALLAAVAGILTEDPWNSMQQTIFLIGAVGVTTISMTWALQTNRELRLARERLATLAVTEERLRIARDLHDLLGHNLSLIVLKSELAGRLVAKAPERAVNEIHDVETVARGALREAREAISSYRQPTLEAELYAAQEMLAAAGIIYSCETMPVTVAPALESVLAWTIREGITNVIRHSRARHCAIKITHEAQKASVCITDDGPALPDTTTIFNKSSKSSTGSGLAGLAERVTALAGQIKAEPCATGGFCLCVTLPLKESRAVKIDSTASKMSEDVQV